MCSASVMWKCVCFTKRWKVPKGNETSEETEKEAGTEGDVDAPTTRRRKKYIKKRDQVENTAIPVSVNLLTCFSLPPNRCA